MSLRRAGHATEVVSDSGGRAHRCGEFGRVSVRMRSGVRTIAWEGVSGQRALEAAHPIR